MNRFAFAFACISALCLCASSLDAQGGMALDFSFTGSGTSTNGEVSYNLDNNVGTFSIFGEEFSATAYYSQLLGEEGSETHMRWINVFGVSVDGSRIAVLYIGVDPTDMGAALLWVEDGQNDIAPFELDQSMTQFVDLAGQPSILGRVPRFPNLGEVHTQAIGSDVAIKGEHIYLDGSRGWMTLSEDGKYTDYTIVAISEVNCEECIEDIRREVHIIFSSEDGSHTGFGVLRLNPSDKTFVELTSYSTPATIFNAEWIVREAPSDLAPVVPGEEDGEVSTQGLCSCSGQQCSCCVHIKISHPKKISETGCLVISYSKSSLSASLKFTLNGKTVYSKTVSAKSPNVCFPVYKVLKFCLKFSNLSLSNGFSGCVALEVKAIVKLLHVNLGCFKI